MGIQPVGIFLDFDCDTFGLQSPLTLGTPTQQLATVTLSVVQDSTVWLTAYVNWIGSVPNVDLQLQILDDDNNVVCTGRQRSPEGAAPRHNTMALSCCDENPDPGERTYRLVATAIGLSGTQTITIQEGTLTGAVIAN